MRSRSTLTNAAGSTKMSPSSLPEPTNSLDSDRLKIAFVFDDSLDKPDGVQQYVLALGRFFAAEGHDVHYLVGETTRTDIPNVHSLSRNVHVRFNQNRMSIPLPVRRQKIRRLLQREQFDIIHVQMPYSPMLAARVIEAADRRAGVVGTFHVAPHSRLVHLANALLSRWLRRSLKRFDEIMPVSPVARQFAADTFGVHGDVVPNTVALETFYAAKPFKKYTKPTIVFLGRLVERKGCRQLLEAIDVLCNRQQAGAKLPDFQVLVCGTGPLESELKQFVRERHLTTIVSFEGFVSESDKPKYLASADITVFPSTGGESFGIVLIEAMAAARGAVLAGNNPGYAALLAGHADALIDPHNPEDVADRLAELLHDPAARAHARAWQRAFVRQFDVSVVTAQVMARYRLALRERRD